MNVFTLMATLTLNKADYDKELDAAEQQAGGFGEKLARGLGTAGKIAGSALAAGASAAAGLAKAAVDAYADYEQLVGGVETLFGTGGKSLEEYAKSVGKSVDDARAEFEAFNSTQESVLKNAQDAYQTAGLSANEYLETVTSFSAALLQATGRGAQQDIEALEAELDAAFKATKRQYEDDYTAAKRAWNDKIRLVEDSELKAKLQQQRDDELTALKRHNEDQLAILKEVNAEQIALAVAANETSERSADSVQRASDAANQAIIDMADNANKMGTSMESVQAAYQGFAKQNYTMLDNLKLGYGGTKTEMERLLRDAEQLSGVKYDIGNLEDVYSAIHVVQENLGITGTTAKEASETISGSTASMKSAWENLVVGMASGEGDMSSLISKFAGSVTTMAKNIVPRFKEAFGGIGQLVTGLAPIIGETLPALVTELLPGLGEAAIGILDALVTGITENLPAISEAALGVIMSLASYLGESMPELIPSVVDMILTLVQGLIDNTPMITDAALALITGLAQGIIDAIPVIVDRLPELITGLINGLLDAIPKLIDAGIELISSLISNIPQIVTNIVNSLPELISGLISGLMDHLPELIATGVDLLVSLVSDGPAIIAGFLAEIPNIIVGLANGIIDEVPKIAQAGKDLMAELFQKLPEIIENVKNRVKEIVQGILDRLKQAWDDMGEAGRNLVKGLWDGIKNAAQWLWDKVKGWLGDLWGGILGFFGIKSPSRKFRDIVGKNLMLGFADGINRYGDYGVDAMDDWSQRINDAVDIDPIEGGLGSTSGSRNRGGWTLNVYAPKMTPAEAFEEAQRVADNAQFLGFAPVPV